MNAILGHKLIVLAEMKKKIKGLEAEASTIQKWILEQPDRPKTVETMHGKLCLTTRDNWTKPDNHVVVAIIGLDSFMEHASITKTGVQTAGGVKAVRILEKMGELEISSTSEYYTLRGK